MAGLESLVSAAYSSLLGDAEHQRFIALLAATFGAHLVALQRDEADHRHVAMDHFDETGKHSAELDRWADATGIENPWMAAEAAQRLLAEGAVCDRGLVDASSLRRTEFFDRILMPLDIFHSLGVLVDTAPSGPTVVTLSRTSKIGHFERWEVDMAQRLAPHLRNIRAIQQSLLAPAIPNDAVVLDTEGHAMAIPDGGGSAVAADVHWQGIARFCEKDANAKATISRVASGVALKANILLPTKTSMGATCLCLHHLAAPLHRHWLLDSKPGVVAFERPLRRSPETARASLVHTYGLTAAECRMLFALYEAESVFGVSRILNRSEETVRTQLKAVFAKTDTHSQLQLLRLVDALDVMT